MKYEYVPKEPGKKQPQEYDRKASGMDKRLLITFIALVVVDLVFYYLGFGTAYSVLRAVLGLVFVLFIPGYVASYAFFKEIDDVERIALSIGLSISLVVLTVMFSNLVLKIPINFGSIVAEILVICGLFYGLSKVPPLNIPPIPKKTMYVISGASLILLIFTVDIFYPYLATTTESSPEKAPMKKVLLSDVYDTSMIVRSFYPQKGLSRNMTNVTIPDMPVIVYDGKIALLSHELENSTVKPGGYFHVKYYWASMNETNKDYMIKVDVTDTKGKIVFTQDHRPTGNAKRMNGAIDGFDGQIKWKGASSTNNSVKFDSVTDYAKSGKSLMVTYHIENSTRNDWAFAYYTFQTDDWSNYKNISFWVYNPNTPVITDRTGVFWIKVYEENNSIYRYSSTLKNGWTYVSAPFDLFKLAPWTKDNGVFNLDQIKNVQMGFEDPAPKMPLTFSLFFDDLRLTPETAIKQAYQPYPLSLWKTGDIIAEEYDVQVPNIGNGTYLIRVGVSDAGKLIPITSGSFIDNQNRAVIDSIEVNG